MKIASNNLPYFFMDLRKPMGFKGMTKRDLHWENPNTPLTIIDVSK
jgi:hypothetical protein